MCAAKAPGVALLGYLVINTADGSGAHHRYRPGDQQGRPNRLVGTGAMGGRLIALVETQKNSRQPANPRIGEANTAIALQ
jgi:hypothetical protein